MRALEDLFAAVSDFLWGPPLMVLVVGGGCFFVIYSRGLPYRYFRHAVRVLAGRYDPRTAPGDLPHFQALSTALSGTLGLGNIAGVAVAVTMGGPGAVFWMWVTAVVGVATKFFTCTSAVLFRGYDSAGRLQGGPMYMIREGMGPRWWPLAALFCVAGLFGTLPVFQINQLTEALREAILVPGGVLEEGRTGAFNALFGVAVAALVALVIFGGIRRIGHITARLVPVMVAVYLVCAFVILALHVQDLPHHLAWIVRDAFSGGAVAGGLLGTMIVGVRQGAFSNEAGIGTEVMALGATRTAEPVRAGLVGMVGPVVDTLVVCTATALVILVTGAWEEGDGVAGAALTAAAFAEALGPVGPWLVALLVTAFSLTTMFTFWYYGAKCLGFLIGAAHQHWYRYFYTALVVVGAVASLEVVIYLITAMYGLMAIPTMTATLMLAPRVLREARRYVARQRAAGTL